MFWKWFRLVFLLILTSTIYLIGQNGIPFLETPVPPLGKLINPFTGFWKNDKNYNSLPDEIIDQNLKEEVIVKWDERQVPHIFATNDADLYFVQGYLTARDRLWQMDFISRVSGGRVAEVVGEKALEFDRFHRNIGLLRSAQSAIDTLKSYPDEYAALENYSRGVNAYITSLKPKNYPVEFKILDYDPELWSPLKSALILKYMAWDLDGDNDENDMSQAKAFVPDSIFSQLYPTERPYYKPIIPSAYKKPSRKTTRSNQQPVYNYYQPIVQDSYQKGSNNWVVNGQKSRSGMPILANDPHLSLSLPSIWYETQLNNGNSNVYGVTIPGVPMIVIGFNEDVAWGLTYTVSDPIDFTKMVLNQEKTQYQLDGKWENALTVTDTIIVKGMPPVVNKSLITKLGPIVYIDSLPRYGFNSVIPGENVAMNWTALGPTTEFVTMYRLNRAKNLQDYQEALPFFKAPGQNMIFASKDNDIAIWHNGKFPIRTEDKARFTQSEATSDLVWNNFIPFEELPHSINPRENFLFSANQSPVSGNYPYYLGSDGYTSFQRCNRIEEVLDSLNAIVPFDFQQLQLDNHSILAEMLLPTLLDCVDYNQLSPESKDVYNELKSWDYEYDALAKSPGFFDAWFWQIRQAIWFDEAKPEDRDKDWLLPFEDRTTQLILTDTLSNFFDDQTTPIIEDWRDIIEKSFNKTSTEFIEKHGSLSDQWQWGNINPTSINSLANLPGFGAKNIVTTGGSKRSVNALSGSHGPSWRMIVEVGKEPHAFGVFPGGQSGNPGSENYDSNVEAWAKGQYFKLYLLKNSSDQPVNLTKTLFKPSK